MKIAGKITLLATLTALSATTAFAGMPNGHGKMEPITRAEALSTAGARFDAADANADGVLDAGEARDMAHGMRGKVREHRAERDRPGHRDTTRGEAHLDFQPIERADALARAAERFDAADSDGDGTLTRAEMKEAAGKMRGKIKDAIKERRGGRHGEGKRVRGDRGDLFERLDADGSGEISREEFRAAREARQHKR